MKKTIQLQAKGTIFENEITKDFDKFAPKQKGVIDRSPTSITARKLLKRKLADKTEEPTQCYKKTKWDQRYNLLEISDLQESVPLPPLMKMSIF